MLIFAFPITRRRPAGCGIVDAHLQLRLVVWYVHIPPSGESLDLVPSETPWRIEDHDTLVRKYRAARRQRARRHHAAAAQDFDCMVSYFVENEIITSSTQRRA